MRRSWPAIARSPISETLPPFDFGRIAAANSLSDVWAMGGRPLFALSILAVPVKLGPDIPGRIIEGAAAVALEAGIPILGGHSVDDAVPKFGLVAIGIVDPGKMTTNRGARAGSIRPSLLPPAFGSPAT